MEYETRHFQKFFEELQRRMTPAQFGDLLDILLRHQAELLAVAQKHRDREAIWRFGKTVFWAFVAVCGLLATLKQLVPEGTFPW